MNTVNLSRHFVDSDQSVLTLSITRFRSNDISFILLLCFLDRLMKDHEDVVWVGVVLAEEGIVGRQLLGVRVPHYGVVPGEFGEQCGLGSGGGLMGRLGCFQESGLRARVIRRK